MRRYGDSGETFVYCREKKLVKHVFKKENCWLHLAFQQLNFKNLKLPVFPAEEFALPTYKR